MVLEGRGPSPRSHRRDPGQNTDGLLGLNEERLSGCVASDMPFAKRACQSRETRMITCQIDHHSD